MEHSHPTFRRYLPYAVTIVIIVVLVASFIAASVPTTPTLYTGEVRYYQEHNLASIANVYENAVAGTQYINASTYRLTINGLVSNPLQLTYNEVVNGGFQSYLKVVTIYCVEGWNATILWEGVLIRDLLTSAGANMTASTVIFRAKDGYSTALSLPYLASHNILLAYKMNNLTIPPERGFPFELVAETQAGYKWIKWLTQIEVSNNSGYLGYWESRGYPNNATIG